MQTQPVVTGFRDTSEAIYYSLTSAFVRFVSFLPALIGAAIILPGGFLLGGFVTYDGDPGTGVWLVPIGALLMLYGVGRTALDLTKASAVITSYRKRR